MTVMSDRQTQLVEHYIEEYLKTRGHTWQSVHALPPDEAKRIFIAASTYASTRLAEIEARAHAVEDIHGSAQLR